MEIGFMRCNLAAHEHFYHSHCHPRTAHSSDFNICADFKHTEKASNLHRKIKKARTLFFFFRHVESDDKKATWENNIKIAFEEELIN